MLDRSRACARWRAAVPIFFGQRSMCGIVCRASISLMETLFTRQTEWFRFILLPVSWTESPIVRHGKLYLKKKERKWVSVFFFAVSFFCFHLQNNHCWTALRFCHNDMVEFCTEGPTHCWELLWIMLLGKLWCIRCQPRILFFVHRKTESYNQESSYLFPCFQITALRKNLMILVSWEQGNKMKTQSGSRKSYLRNLLLLWTRRASEAAAWPAACCRHQDCSGTNEGSPQSLPPSWWSWCCPVVHGDNSVKKRKRTVANQKRANWNQILVTDHINFSEEDLETSA